MLRKSVVKFRFTSILSLLILVSLFLNGCISSHSLTYNILLRNIPLETQADFETAPKIIIIASIDEIDTPAKGVAYPKIASENLSKVDYTKLFAVLFLVGQVNEDDIINEVVRKGSHVTIVLDDYSVGPGNYELPGYTAPYQLITIEKTGTWGDNFNFKIIVDQSDLFAEINHYIP